MKIYKDQRIGVLIDVQNLYYSAKNLYHQKVDFEAILKEAIQDRALIRAIAYVVRAEETKEQTFFDALERIGYEVKAKDLQIFYGGAKKADWDVGIAMDAIELAPKLDVIILVSGDGDYVPLVQHLRRAFGCRIEGMAFGSSTSSKLKEELDLFTDLDKNKKYLIKSYPPRPTPQAKTPTSNNKTQAPKPKPPVPGKTPSTNKPKSVKK